MTEQSVVLKTSNLCKSFFIDGKEINVLDNFNVEINKGEFVSLVGPSGCGKSTFLKLVMSIENITSGEIEIDGNKINGVSEKISMIFQEPRLLPWLNVEKNIGYVLPDHLSKKEKREIVDYHLKLVGLEKFKKAVPAQLSGGMQQRVSIARALALSPEILLLDEPFGALDAFTRSTMQEELLNIWQEKKTTMILVTHDIDEAIYLSNRILVMSANPGRCKRSIPVNISYPRAKNENPFLELRKTVLSEFMAKPKELEYYI